MKKNKVDKVQEKLTNDNRITLNGSFLDYNNMHIINLDTRSIAFKGWFNNDVNYLGLKFNKFETKASR